MLDLEFKMKRRKQQHEKNILMVRKTDYRHSLSSYFVGTVLKVQMKPEEQLNFKNCKLKEAVHKFILARKLQRMREQQLSSLTSGMKTLKRQFEDKKQDAMEKMASPADAINAHKIYGQNRKRSLSTTLLKMESILQISWCRYLRKFIILG